MNGERNAMSEKGQQARLAYRNEKNETTTQCTSRIRKWNANRAKLKTLKSTLSRVFFIIFAGDTVLWANTRLLHARSAFSMSMGKTRRLSGCYFSWDILKSRIRQLRDKLNHPLNQPSA
ncbi:unnamed protein product [Toxocara canis]|uniref:TauD domain-containing protein n=1 Tax=Toxocara canis TaxID=6265 RepID=A0A183V843_TOXCA|nr:unnamed protein product [Toxocara canis]